MAASAQLHRYYQDRLALMKLALAERLSMDATTSAGVLASDDVNLICMQRSSALDSTFTDPIRSDSIDQLVASHRSAERGS